MNRPPRRFSPRSARLAAAAILILGVLSIAPTAIGAETAAAAPEKPAAAAAPAAASASAPAPAAKPAESKPAEVKPPEKPPDAKPPAPAEKPPEAKSAEAKPAPAASTPAAAGPPKPADVKVVDTRGRPASLALLAYPANADRIKLTPQQRAGLAAIVEQREAALRRATDAERPAIMAGFETKMAALLTEAQVAELTKTPPEPLLRMNYRYQRWLDVLEEVAKQAGLSLVLEAPPPGTFNYTSDKDYTPTDAIDLLNGVLLTKGYTLIRRDRMLVVVDLSEGIP